MTRPRLLRVAGAIAMLALIVPVVAADAAAPETLPVTASQRRAVPGETVAIALRAPTADAAGRMRAVLLAPRAAAAPLDLTTVSGDALARHATVTLARDASPGIYVVHAWLGDRAHPAAVGKAIVVVRPVVVDFAVMNYFDVHSAASDLDAYLDDFTGAGGNVLIAHNLITSAGAYYPSRIARTQAVPEDLVELILDRADRRGLAVLLSVGWDVTRTAPYAARFAETTALIDELYARYAQHPSLIGFYSWQEGSGTYYAGYVRAFADYVKRRNATLTTACAPHIDDPVLIGYLGAVDALDMMIVQSGTMASYRPDNRKRYPIRRVRDFCGLGPGAGRLQDKIALTHVELFGYLETRMSDAIVTTTPGNITRQLLSAATVPGADGVALFTYHAHIYAQRKQHPEVEASRVAVRDALRTFSRAAATFGDAHGGLAVYLPYSDWVVERWTNSYLPALDGFRLLGASVELSPWSPAAAESVLPYYPIHHNEPLLQQMLRERRVLLLPDVSGFQQTDSDLIDAFVKGGGVVVFFGPQVPMGRTYDRRALIGADERPAIARHAIIAERDLGGRVTAGVRFALNDRRAIFPGWQAAAGARVLARFDDGSAAAFEQSYGRGLALTIALDVRTAADCCRDLVRDAIDRALGAAGAPPALFADGTSIDTDMRFARTDAGTQALIANLGDAPLDIVLSAPGAAAIHIAPGEAAQVVVPKAARAHAEGHRLHAVRSAVPGPQWQAAP